MNRVVIYGYGNPGRQDDGLGPALAEKIGTDQIPGVLTESNYQLNIEDAALIAEADCVIFVDASLTGEEGFFFDEIEPADGITFTTHAISPQSVLALCEELFGKKVRAYILGIKGYGWDFAEGLTPEAEKNFDDAYRFLRGTLDDLITGSPEGRALTLN
ncbi:MAG TPA: hydrogenase maturation protease [Spirochaetota bacterium]|nr:hydrogenase maturation protease [Spirochaetota bacterium]HPI89896.1 hydrogenase maturation protease [Spirochaetota bacterium]HPR47829.1 hydrogenase maturation protease [Spirochaetota bacterium]